MKTVKKKASKAKAAPQDGGLIPMNPLLIEIWEVSRGRFGRNQYAFEAYDARDQTSPFSGVVWSENRQAADTDVRLYVENLVADGDIKAEWNGATLSWLYRTAPEGVGWQPPIKYVPKGLG